MTENAKMKNSQQLEEVLIDRNQCIRQLTTQVTDEKNKVDDKKYRPLFKTIDELTREHKQTDCALLELIGTVCEIEKIWEELHNE